MTSNTATLTVQAWLCRGTPLVPTLGVPDTSVSEPWYLTRAEAAAVCGIFNGLA
jgi:hypothetical protein